MKPHPRLESRTTSVRTQSSTENSPFCFRYRLLRSVSPSRIFCGGDMKHSRSLSAVYFCSVVLSDGVPACMEFWNTQVTFRIFPNCGALSPKSEKMRRLLVHGGSPQEFMVWILRRCRMKIQGGQFQLSATSGGLRFHLGSPRCGYLSTVLGTCPL